MKILHYTLGFQPDRTGGLVNYVTDLMSEQKSNGHDVIALFPGKLDIFKRKTYIEEKAHSKMRIFQIVNSLPLPIFGGIRTPKKFMSPVADDMYSQFLKFIQPDVIHVHTLMGIHQEFFYASKELKIPIVYTTHDYFGLAPEPNFFDGSSTYDHENTVENWMKASSNSLSTKKLRVFQLRSYRYIRWFFRKLPSKRKNTELDTGKIDYNFKPEYADLKKYYTEIFNMVSMFHFNSSVAKDVFTQNLSKPIWSHTITITTSSITKYNIRVLNERNLGLKKIAYIGPNKVYKGFNEFIELANFLKNDNFEFHTYGYEVSESIVNVYQHGKYNINDLEEIYNGIDYLVVPSLWKETFCLVALEALSHGTMVFVNENVGVKDLIPEEFHFSDIYQIPNKINMIPQELNIKLKTIEKHYYEIQSLYEEVLENEC